MRCEVCCVRGVRSYNGEDSLSLGVEVVFSYDGNVQHHTGVNTVAGRDQPLRVEKRGSTGGKVARSLESHHPGVLVHLAALSSHHSLERVPGAALCTSQSLSLSDWSTEQYLTSYSSCSHHHSFQPWLVGESCSINNMMSLYHPPGNNIGKLPSSLLLWWL